MADLTDRLAEMQPDAVPQTLANEVTAGRSAKARKAIENLPTPAADAYLLLLAEACARADDEAEALACVDSLIHRVEDARGLDVQMFRCDLLARFHKTDEAVAALEQLATDYHRKKDHVAAAQCLRQLSDLHLASDNFEQALAANTLGTERMAKFSDHPLMAVLAAQRGGLLSISGKTKEALQAFEKAIDCIDDQAHPDEAWAIDVVEAAGVVCLLQEPPDLDRAEELLNLALSRVTRNYGAEHPRAAATWKHLATLCLLQGKAEEAKSLAERAVRIEGSASAKTYHLLAATKVAGGDKAGALAAIAKGLAQDASAQVKDALSSLKSQLSSR